MNRLLALLLLLGATLAIPTALAGQESLMRATAPLQPPEPVRTPAAALAALPDSVRQRVGFQHWKGAAIGGGIGALAGLALALGAHGQCADCSSDSPPAGKVTLLGAGIGGAFGFLVGLASPRYRWIKAEGP